MAEYNILPTVYEEMNRGWVWIPKGIENIKSRTYIKIEWLENKPDNSKPIRCQIREIDSRFRNKYKEHYKNNSNYIRIIDEPNTVVMNWYFRDRFGITEEELENRIKNHEKFDIIISKSNCIFQKIWAFLIHPDDVVKIATYLGLISIIISIILGGLSIYFSITN